MIIHNRNNHPIQLDAGMLPGYNGPVIGGTTMRKAVTESFEMCVQEFRASGFLLRYNWLHFFSKEHFTCYTTQPGLHGRVVMENDLPHQHAQLGDLTVHQDEAVLIWANESECKTVYHGGKTYVTFDIYTSPQLITQLVEFFPELKDTVINGASKLITQSPCFITPSMKDIIRQMIEHPYDAATSGFYFDIKVKEFLFSLLKQYYSRQDVAPFFSEYERSRIYKARQKLLENVARNCTIDELSKYAGINAFKLKLGFRQFFGMGVFQCLQEKRMQHARELLLNTSKPIKEIAGLAGYGRTTNFITAFRRRFGYPPGALRREG